MVSLVYHVELTYKKKKKKELAQTMHIHEHRFPKEHEPQGPC